MIQLKVNFKSSKIIVMTIGQVAKDSGLAASAIRFYERAGLLPKPVRIGGRRQYESSVLERLAVLDRAKACGFSLAEARQLFCGFREGVPPSERWQTLARRKIIELEEMERKISATRELLNRACSCKDLAECGRQILANERSRRQARGSLALRPTTLRRTPLP
jgi:MerR family redox-sensitive transcriptional activator SoxR